MKFQEDKRIETREEEAARIAMEDAVIRATAAGMTYEEILESVQFALGMAG